jgi:putative redox protein
METQERIKWVSATIGSDKYKTILRTDTQTIIGDEPLDNGGKDLGPSPGDLLRMSLASCTAITLRMYADRKGYDVKEIEVKVHLEKAEFKNIFHCDIYIDGNIDGPVRNRMLQIANACPIHKILTQPIEVLTALK